MQKIAIITKFDVDRDPRPKRFSVCLNRAYNVSIIGPGKCNDRKITHVPMVFKNKKTVLVRLLNTINLLLRHYKIYLHRKYAAFIDILKKSSFDLIIVHDLEILPIAVELRKSAKIIFDAREYFPLHYEDNPKWNLYYKNMNHYICSNYLQHVNEMFTVSEGILEKYNEIYKKRAKLIESWPEYEDIQPTHVGQKVRIIYHGGANANRKLELMVRMMDQLDERFSLDLMLVGGEKGYLQYLNEEVGKTPRVKIIDPVDQNDIVRFCADYDIGIFICPPTTFNLRHALPNKLFEYIQSRLMIAISPSIEMVKIVKHYDLGVISDDFYPDSMAKKLKKLTVADIVRYKENSDRAAKILNAEANCVKLKSVVSEIIH